MKDDVLLTLCHPDSDVKMNMLRDTVNKMKGDYPIALATHLPVDMDIVDKVDYFIYEKEDVPSDSHYDIYYHFVVPGDVSLRTRRPTPYHALAGYISHKSAATFFRSRFRNLHYIQYDTSMKIPEYIGMAKEKLESFKFVGAQYHVPGQNISGLVGTFFSYNIRWFDNRMPEVHTWSEWESYGRDNGDGLMGENWLHNYFTDRRMIPDCYFVTPKEMEDYFIGQKMQTRGDTEPGIKAYLSEMDDHRLILFIHLYVSGRTLPISVDINGAVHNVDMPGGVVCWWVIEKTGYVRVASEMQTISFQIDSFKEYTDTVFKFEDNKFICLKQF